MQANPLWPVNVRFPKLKDEIDVDIAVIGGGIAGISSAYNLAKAGYSVAVLEQDEVGSGATGASSGVLYYGSGTNLMPAVKLFGKKKATLLWKETANVIEDITGTVKKFKIECGLRRPGAIMVAKTKEEARKLEGEQRGLKHAGIITRLLATKEVREYYPFREFLSGLAFDQCAQVHPGRLAAGLAKAANLRVYENTKVTGWEEAKKGIVVRASEAKVNCSKLLFATNNQPYFDMEKDFSLESSVILASKSISNMKKIWPREKIIWTMEEKYDLAYTQDDRFVLELYEFLGNESKLAYYYPGIDFEVQETWGGVWAKTSDWMPITSKVSENIFVNIGMGDQGIIMGWLTGKNVVDLIKGKSNWFLEMTTHERFHKARE